MGLLIGSCYQFGEFTVDCEEEVFAVRNPICVIREICGEFFTEEAIPKPQTWRS